MKNNKSQKRLTDISHSDCSTSNIQNVNHKRSSAREKKPNHKEDLGFIEAKAKCKDPKILEICKRCEKVITKLKKHSFADHYTSSNTQDIPCFNEVEKKIKNYAYNSLHSFALDLRMLFKYYLSTGVSNVDLYSKTAEISHYFEEILIEAEENTPDQPGFDLLSKKIQKLENQFNNNEKLKQHGSSNSVGHTGQGGHGGTMGGSHNQNSLYMQQKQTPRVQVPLSEKPMTITEKNALGNNIRQLTQEQMKGILNILSDQYSLDKNSKYFEFDIDHLSTKKLRDLEKYVKKCFKSKGGSTTQPSNNNVNKNNISGGGVSKSGGESISGVGASGVNNFKVRSFIKFFLLLNN